MRIISQTSNEIKIASNNQIKIGKISSKGSFRDNLVFLLLAFTVFPITPLGFFFGIGTELKLIGVTRVICDRVEPQQVDCQVSNSKFFDFVREETVNIKFVQSANFGVIETVNSENANTYKYNFQLINKFGGVKTFDSDQDTANKTVQSVNSFLASQQISLNYTVDGRTNPIVIVSLIFLLPFSLFILYICFILWVIILRAFSEEEIILNKYERSFICIETTFILGKKIDDYKFTDIAKVDVLYANASYDNIVFAPRITMTSGVKYNLDTIGDRQAAINIANDLNRFMGLPEEEDPVVKE